MVLPPNALRWWWEKFSTRSSSAASQGVFDRIYLMQEGTEEVPKEVENLHERISGSAE